MNWLRNHPRLAGLFWAAVIALLLSGLVVGVGLLIGGYGDGSCCCR